MKNFDERFKRVYPRITQIAAKYGRTTAVPAEEYESYLCYEFIAIDKAFDAKLNNSYSAYVGAMLELKAKRMTEASRSDRKFYDSIKYLEIPEDNDDETKYPLELVSDVDIEEQVFDDLFIAEQIAKADDDVTRQILVAFFSDPYATFRGIAAELGLDRGLVKRRLTAVAKAVSDNAK